MKKILIIFAIMSGILASCKPETYTGPLDSPVGNWRGIRTEYYFNGEHVGFRDGCEYSAISFYPDGLCCIENVKGAFPFLYDNATGDLQIDSSLWSVSTLTGEQMVMTYLGRIFPTEETPEDTGSDAEAQSDSQDGAEDVQPDENGLILPVEYKGVEINADSYGYYYKSADGENVYCRFAGSKNEEGILAIEFWYDIHTDTFIPLFVEKED